MNKLVNPFTIIKTTEKVYGLKQGAITSKCRSRTIAEARAIAMYLVRKLTIYSLPEIGDHFNRHHSTVLHDIDKASRLITQGKCNISYPLINSLLREYQQ